jgi:orotidine-5'-phosphate decarboxylase
MSRIIFPLDFSNVSEAEYFIDILKEHVAMFKIGLELFYKAGPNWVKNIVKEKNIKLFLDVKLHDIPNTVLGAVRNLLDINPEFITVHLDEAKQFREIVYKKSKFEGFLCVSFLTSLNDADLHNLYVDKSITVSDYVLKKAELSVEAGCKGLVCSASEAGRVKAEYGDELVVVTPGIRLQEGNVTGDDQKRIVTPYEAVLNGSDFLVIGRPIRRAKNPVEVCEKINIEVNRALSLF